MAEATAPTDANLALQQAVAALWVSAQSMVRALAGTGSPLFTPEVQTFQIKWNAVVPMLPGGRITGPAGSCKPGTVISHLAEDGQYGPLTSTGLYAFIGTAGARSSPPCKAASVPTWAAQNADIIATWVPPDHASDNVEIVGPSAAANTVLTAAKEQQSASVISAKDDGGANTQTIQQTTAAVPTSTPAAVVTKAAAAASLCEAWGGSARKRCKKLGFEKFVKAELATGRTVFLAPDHPKRTIKRTVNPAGALCNVFTNQTNRTQCRAAGFEAYLRARLLQGDAFEFTPTSAAHNVVPATPTQPAAPVVIDEPAHVVVAPPQGATPVLAIGIGMLALGGLLWWFMQPKRHA